MSVSLLLKSSTPPASKLNLADCIRSAGEEKGTFVFVVVVVGVFLTAR